MRGTQSSTGSGSIIEGQRILTNGHVVQDQTFIQVRRFGESRRYQARVLYVSHTADLALLTVDDPTFFEGVEPLTFGPLPDTQEEVVVMLKVLAADVNQGYHDESHWLIDAVNGEAVRNLKHLIKLVEAGEGDEFIEFTNTGGQQIVLDRQKVKAHQAAILNLYRVPEDRSEDLRLP